MAYLVEAAQLSHRYGNVHALSPLDLSLQEGTSVAFIGPDGVGKSTLLGLIAGAKRVQSGGLRVFEKDVCEADVQRELQHRIAYMPQGLGKNLYPELSIYENLDFFAQLYQQGKAERKARIEYLLKATGLLAFIHRPAGKLSGGMKQKLSLCCALIHDPDVLILDEPTTGVDPLSRQQFWQLIASIRQTKPRLTVLVATSYMEEAEQFEHVVMMDAGCIIAQGTPSVLKEQAQADVLECAFIHFLPLEKRAHHETLHVPARDLSQHAIAIEARGLTRQFGDFVAVDHVDFSIPVGEIYGFLGSNGCGKTTTMKMLTGLLPASSGTSLLFGQPLVAGDITNRQRIGYMSQAFSLYGELTVHQNLTLHAHLYGLEPQRAQQRIQWLYEVFDLEPYRMSNSAMLPLGVRQRLSLAVAVIHEPEILILDEPTSGVDPIARDKFWSLLIRLAHEHHVTIFISTHFMNEAERCDRISLMHAGKVIASGVPRDLREQQHAASLNDAFIAYLEQADAQAQPNTVTQAPSSTPENNAAYSTDITQEKSTELSKVTAVEMNQGDARQSSAAQARFSWLRVCAYFRREMLELFRDPVRLGIATLGMSFLMLVFGYGITLDVNSMRYAVLDRDRTPDSRFYAEALAGSPYFKEQAPLQSHAQMLQHMQHDTISMVLEFPPRFGEMVHRGQYVALAATIDGAMPFRAETIAGYLQGIHQRYLHDMGIQITSPLVIEDRFRYNQSFESVNAMVPSVMALMLVFIPAILAALSVVREKEMGSIINLYVTPVSRFEFLLGKQLPYVCFAMFGFVIMFVLARTVFHIPFKGSFCGLALGAMVYVFATTGIGFMVSSFTNSQISALFGTAIMTMMPATQFSGMLRPVSTLEGGAYWMGYFYPTTYFIKTSVGAFTKGLDFISLLPFISSLLLFVPVLLVVNVCLLRKQER